MTETRRFSSHDDPAFAEFLEARYATHTRFQSHWNRLIARTTDVGKLRRMGLIALQTRYGNELGLRGPVPPGIVLLHNALGSVFHPDTVLEGPALIFHRVTIGNTWPTARYGPSDPVPRIRPMSIVGAGASIIGSVTVGPFAVVGTNAVVTRDVAPFTAVVGHGATHRYSINRLCEAFGVEVETIVKFAAQLNVELPAGFQSE